MRNQKIHFEHHSITVSAPTKVVFDLIVDVTKWPQLFGPTIYAQRIERRGDEERLKLWALANDDVRTWTSRRHLDPRTYRIRFRQETPQTPVLSMGGEWSLKPLPDERTIVELEHHFSAVDDNPDSITWIIQVTDKNSQAELNALKIAAEQHDELERLFFSFSDSLLIQGAVEDVYEFIYRAQDWPERLPHVSRLSLQEHPSNIQVMEMDTRATDGSTHTTKSVRICFPHNKIVYKQIKAPRLMTAHTGCWTFTQTPLGLKATSQHTVGINRLAVQDVLGPRATIEDAKAFARKALSINSLTTLRQAKSFIEARR